MAERLEAGLESAHVAQRSVGSKVCVVEEAVFNKSLETRVCVQAEEGGRPGGGSEATGLARFM